AKQAQVRAIGGTGGDDGMDKALKSFLRPEFLNRIDSVVKFNELSSEAIDAVIVKFMNSLNDTVAERGVKVKLTDEAVAWLAQNGVQVGMGARPMKRTIEQNIRVPLAKEMLCGSLQNGGSVTFDVIDGKLGIKSKRSTKKSES
ncbi:MAG: ATP-dependent Clp protease ATP-binding subunit ClpA, partial [Hafnia sp.]